MFKLAKPFFLICETSLHAGSGSDLGIVDLPIQREKHTQFPKIESSSLKGSIREAFEQRMDNIPEGITTAFTGLNNGNYIKEGIFSTFGPDESEEEAHAGALGFTEARLILFPVKSMLGVFGWITCPQVLQRFIDDLRLCNPLKNVENKAPSNSQLFVQGGKVVFEEYTFSIKKEADGNCSKLAAWLADHILPSEKEYDFWREKMKKDIAVIPDNDFRDFVTLSTEVIARTKIADKTGTVVTGGLWYEEYLPTDSILYSLVLASPIFKKDSEKGIFKQNGKKEEDLVMAFFEKGLPEIIQVGGNATIGKGIVRTNIYMEGK